MQKIYVLEGLDCANCAMKIERQVAKVKGVQEANVDFVTKKLYVEYEDATIEEAILSTVTSIEPEVVPREVKKKKPMENKSQKHVHAQEDSCCEHAHSHDEKHEHHHDHDGCSCTHAHVKEVRELQGADKLYLTGLDCANCAAKIERHVAGMENVADASLNFSNGILFVQMKDKVKKEETLMKIMEVIPTLEDGVLVEKEKKVQETESKYGMFSFRNNAQLYSGIFLFLVGLFFHETAYSVWIFLAAFVFAGGKVVITAMRNVLKGEVFDENFLMSIATIGAFAIQDYEEAVAVMIFYEIGEMFQSYAVNRSRKSISSLMNIRADYANVLDGEQEIKKTPEDVKIGELILVKPGERVPLDGIIIKGSSALDTSALTGESMPRDVHIDDEVLAGVVNLSGVLTMKVTKPYGESTVSRILELVENASSKKAPMEKFITKFARVYTPSVVALAVALAILPPLFSNQIHVMDMLESALTFLVVSCPCALVVSIPLGLFAGIGAASKQGILIKGGNYLEALQNIDTVVFDKTGTLTKGVFRVVEVNAQQGSKEALLQLAAYGEYHSSHPIALSIKEAYGKTIDASYLQHYEEVAGNGIQVEINGEKVLLGNEKLMQKHGISTVPCPTPGTIIHIAKENVYLGYVLINDEMKETSKQAIQELKRNGVKRCIMLSGDRKEVGEHVAKELALDEVHMQLLPADKVARVEELLQQEDAKHKLAFVGDGMNDAPVLARADVGVAMGGIGSDAAIEAADIVLMKDDPLALSEAFRIARKTMYVLWQNIVFSLGVKGIVLALAALGIANMWMGVFADVGVTLLAVLNSMRILRMKKK